PFKLVFCKSSAPSILRMRRCQPVRGRRLAVHPFLTIARPQPARSSARVDGDLKIEDRLPVVLHAHDGPNILPRGVERSVVFLLVSVFASGVIVVDEELEGWATALLGICELADVAARANVASREYRLPANLHGDADRLHVLVIEQE